MKPACWKNVDVTPIEKVKPLTSMSELQPISILNGSGKIAEKVLCDIYKTEVSIQNNQNAYVQNGGTTIALILMIDDWTKLLDDTKCKAVRLLLVDMTKAFDRLSHLKLLEKQSKMEINQYESI